MGAISTFEHILSSFQHRFEGFKVPLKHHMDHMIVNIMVPDMTEVARPLLLRQGSGSSKWEPSD